MMEKSFFSSQLFVHNMEKTLSSLLPSDHDSRPYLYSLLPPGKLFRPKLVYALAKDLTSPDLFSCYEKDFFHLALSLEVHHTYTLIHDDLPCMDNDEVRRGRPTLHMVFDEWHALLAGDALLNVSFGLLAKLPPSCLPQLLHYYSWATGPKGLIKGQVLDLQKDSNTTLLHELKTARLMQLALVGTALILQEEKKFTLRDFKILHRLGQRIGLLFQLADDLDDIKNEKESANAFQRNPEEAQKKMDDVKKDLEKIFREKKLPQLELFTMSFFT